MVKTTLVGPDLALAQEILRTLDHAKFPITLAMWLLQKERADWTLVVATPLYDRLGPQKAYLQLINLLSAEYPHVVMDLPIRLESNRRPIIKELRKMFGQTASVEGTRIGLQSIGGVWIDDAYIYRIK